MKISISADARDVLDSLVDEYNSSPSPVIEICILIADELLHHYDDYTGYHDLISSAALYMDSVRNKQPYAVR